MKTGTYIRVYCKFCLQALFNMTGNRGEEQVDGSVRRADQGRILATGEDE